jgi:hypothetical protein
MPAAKPTQAAIRNVIEAMIACGLTPGAVRVQADGGFVVEPAGLDPREKPAQDAPRKFGDPR